MIERVVNDVTPAPWPRARLPLPRDEIVNSDGKGPPAIVVGERQRDRRVRPTRRAERAAIQFACCARLALPLQRGLPPARPRLAPLRDVAAAVRDCRPAAGAAVVPQRRRDCHDWDS